MCGFLRGLNERLKSSKTMSSVVWIVPFFSLRYKKILEKSVDVCLQKVPKIKFKKTFFVEFVYDFKTNVNDFSKYYQRNVSKFQKHVCSKLLVLCPRKIYAKVCKTKTFRRKKYHPG